MRHLLVSIVLIMVVLLLGACRSNPSFTGTPTDPGGPNPPDNPGGQTYQLSATIGLSRAIGHAPLPVNLYANVNGGMPPYYYRWDVNGDGWWDYGGSDVSEVGINYASAGEYNVLLEVEDSEGQFYQATALVDVKPSNPAVLPYAWPLEGPAPFETTFNGAGSSDQDGYIVYWQWDFQSDGIWDAEGNWVIGASNNAVETFIFENQGTYDATLRVTDDDGLISEASVQVIAL
ncbi:MAG: PKD domain-containing protein [bacterium]|nr:PKD domain-containing protein [bacterium]